MRLNGFFLCLLLSLFQPGPRELAQTSPDGRHVAFIRDNNLWISAKPLTRDGNANLLVGVPDVVYAREFDVRQHYWWSPDSSSVAYIETEFADANHYVAAGGKLPLFRLKIADIASGQSRKVTESSEDWAYLLRVAWSPDSRRLVFYRMNRLQNLAELCEYAGGSVKTLLTEKDAYWVNVPETPVFVEGGRRLVVSSERSGNKHVYLYESDGRLVRDLTPPDLEVSEFHAARDASHIYVSGSTGNRQDQQLFRVKLDGSGTDQVKALSVAWHAADKPVANEFFTIKTHDNVALPARLFKPDHFDPQKKYPLILYTFSGPRGRVVADVEDGWQMTWNRDMVRLGYLVLAVDVRGSGGYGHSFEEYIHYRFGAQEVADLREVVNYLRRQTYVDGGRLGIWGCGYGAHTVVQAMWQFPGGFKAGFADSPIADWTKYDAYFTERYLGMPANRFNEYDDSSPVHSARKMTGTMLVTTDPDNPLIRPDQLEDLEKAMARVKQEDVRKRFEVLKWPGDSEKLMAAMTDFFTRTL